MSIECLIFDTDRFSLQAVQTPPKPPISARRLAANRRNALKSTGPRTAAGKKRSSRNALKHGLCAANACLKGEEKATFLTYVGELEEELRPRTAVQRFVFDQLADVMWRLTRLPEAQADMFERELELAGDGVEMTASQLLAARFSEDPRNGFILMGRYETSLRNQMLRLMRSFDQLKKHRPTVPYDDDEPPCPRERAWSGMEAPKLDLYWEEEEENAAKPQATDIAEERTDVDGSRVSLEAPPAERSQLNPPQTGAGGAESGNRVEHRDRALRNEPNVMGDEAEIAEDEDVGFRQRVTR